MANANLIVAETVRQQLGGNLFSMMTGAKNFVGSDSYLMFSLPSRRINKVKITLNGGDLYDMEFIKVWKGEAKEILKVKNLDCTQLQEEFTKATGLYTRL